MHTPIQAPRKYTAMYKHRKNWSPAKKTYAGMVTAADKSLGWVVNSLKRKGMWKDTLIIYTSDNGALAKYGSNSPHRGGKGDLWEGGIVSDGIIAGPARAKLGIGKGYSKQYFHAVDWFPTLAEIVGVKPKADPALHGVLQLQGLKGGKAPRNELFLGFGEKKFSRVDGYQPENKRPRYAALLRNNLKLIYDFQAKKKMLFNVRNDPAESKNLASKQRKMTQKLWARLKVHIRSGKMPIQKDMTCGDVKFSKAPWGQSVWQPWCS